MKKIILSESFYSATKDDPKLRSVFIDMGFKPMANDKTYLTVGRIVTLKAALANINKSVEAANEFLKENNMEVVLYE